MKAVIFERFGPPEVLQLREVDQPFPNKDEVLIKVRATSVTKYDTWVRSATAPRGFGLIMRLASGWRPKQPVLGTELAGEVAAVGPKVTRFRIGDQVFAYSGMDLGAHAEYACLPAGAVAVKPVNISLEEAAGALQGGLTALYFLRKAGLGPGNKILIFGASGGVGGYAVQLAKGHFGAEVTGVCSAPKAEYVRSLGANRVIDYNQEDFTQDGHVYNVLFDTVGKTNIARSRGSLKADGFYLLATFGLPMLAQIFWFSRTSGLRFEIGTLEEKTEDLILIGELLENGVIRSPIDRCYPLTEAAEAHRYVESGAKMGSVILAVESDQARRPGEGA